MDTLSYQRIMVAPDKILSQHLREEISWLKNVINRRLKSHFDPEAGKFELNELPPPPHKGISELTRIIAEAGLKAEERLVLILSLAPHLQPEILDVFFTRNNQLERGYTEFGGIKGHYFSGFLPTGETALFLLAGNNTEKRQAGMHMFDQDHPFAQQHILALHNPHPGEPLLSGVLQISEDLADKLTAGKSRKPKFSADFPAARVSTEMEWKDLVLNQNTRTQLSEIKAWIMHGDTLMHDWGLKKIIKPGYKCLFYGPPGTGKTLTATLIGKIHKRDVYRIDLSMIVSKYIGETEKNLARVFDRAEAKNWILFFDEADALFGKRTEVSDSHDRYANQEVSYLLQKLEDHDGLVILSSNMKKNIDEAFLRRFQSIIYFPMPSAEERESLWKNSFSAKSELEKDISLKDLAEKYELSGGSIVNVVRFASLAALKNETNRIRKEWIMTGIRNEFLKAGKT